MSFHEKKGMMEEGESRYVGGEGEFTRLMIWGVKKSYGCAKSSRNYHRSLSNFQ